MKRFVLTTLGLLFLSACGRTPNQDEGLGFFDFDSRASQVSARDLLSPADRQYERNLGLTTQSNSASPGRSFGSTDSVNGSGFLSRFVQISNYIFQYTSQNAWNYFGQPGTAIDSFVRVSFGLDFVSQVTAVAQPTQDALSCWVWQIQATSNVPQVRLALPSYNQYGHRSVPSWTLSADGRTSNLSYVVTGQTQFSNYYPVSVPGVAIYGLMRGGQSAPTLQLSMQVQRCQSGYPAENRTVDLSQDLRVYNSLTYRAVDFAPVSGALYLINRVKARVINYQGLSQVYSPFFFNPG